MRDYFVLTINDEQVIEYNRQQRLPGKQRVFLEKMDLDMDAGIKIGDTTVDDPDQFCRVQYVTMHLIRAIDTNDEHMKSAMCAYLATRSPDLQKIIANKQGGDVEVEFVYDNAHSGH